MINFLECPDIHASKNWLDTTLQCLDKIGETAIKEKVDFIAFPGDLHDSRFYVGDSSGYNTFRKKIKELLKICPIVAVEGTESHDGKGSYGPLVDLGMVLLEPSKVYGFFDSPFPDQEPFIADVHLYHMEDPDCILFGIPELNKNTINSKLSRPAEGGNADAVNLLSQHIHEFVGPMRLKYEDIPAIGLLHGTVCDTKKEHSTDIVIRSSDIVIDTDILRPANLDRWSLGHFHVPWESENICAGYAGYPGIDSNPWGKRDFVPGFNLIEIINYQSEGMPEDLNEKTWIGRLDDNGHDTNDFLLSNIRIPYGTPERRKIETIGEIELDSSDIAYWLESSDIENEFPPGVHPWSRITYTEQQTETRRVSKDEAEKAKSLWDLFKLTDPDVQPHIKDKVETIPIKNKFEGFKLDARLTYLKVKGCTLFGGRTVEFDLDNLADGLNQIIGTHGNGDGKSTLLGFCSFYPQLIGKDTKSGRDSAIKDFFSGQDSSIEKRGIVNGKNHRHLITIKGAHTQTPKVECYLYIDDISQLEKATFDTMFDKCEELYGSFDDYAMTTFYEQPQQSTKNQRSGLMTTGATEARNLVQNIAGIDHEADKRFALDEVAEYEKSEQQLQADISALEKYSEDIEELKREEETKIVSIDGNNKHLEETTAKGFTEKEKVDTLQIKKTENEKLKVQKTQKQKDITRLQNEISVSETRIKNFHAVADDLKTNQDAIKKDDEAKILELDYSTLLNEYNVIISDHEKLVIEQGTFKIGVQSVIDNAETTKRSHNKEIELISEPCEKCGYIKPDVQSQIDNLNNSIILLDESIKLSFDNIEKLIPIPDTKIVKPIKPLESLTAFEREVIQDAVTEGLKAETAIEELETSRRKDATQLAECKKDLEKIIVDTEIDLLLSDAEADLTITQQKYTEIKTDISTLEAEKKAIVDRIQKAIEGEKELTEKQESLKVSESNKIDWVYIAKMLNPDKIPALELDIILDSIDSEATRTISPFLEGRYSFRTITQKQNKKNTVDKFDVLIHDAETGEEFSMFYTNPGNKAFYSDCYIKALIRKRNERQMRSYSPIIYDEADGPVNPIRVKAYCDIQEAYFKNEKVLFVSQKDISASYAQKIFNIEEMKS